MDLDDDGGGATASLAVAENTTAITTVVASDIDTGDTLTYSISGGADAAQFAINSSTGELSFISPKDFEAPSDAGADSTGAVIAIFGDALLLPKM